MMISSAGIAAGRRRASASAVQKEEGGWSAGTNVQFSNASGREYMATAFVAASSYTLTAVRVKLLDSNTPSGSVSCYIYSNNSGQPGTLLATATNTLAMPLTGSAAEYQFDFSGLSVTSGTGYYIVLYRAPYNATNYPIWAGTATLGDTERSSDGTNWQNVGGNTLSYRTFGI